MNIGDKAPEILGKDEKGNEIRLSDYAGSKVILFFYPKDNTPGCTAEACSLRDGYEELRAKGYVVIGASIQDGKSHLKFIDKHALPFPLIADTEQNLVQQMGVWGEKSMAGRKYMGTIRTTFVIDEQGVITHILQGKKVDTKHHAEQLMALLSE